MIIIYFASCLSANREAIFFFPNDFPFREMWVWKKRFKMLNLSGFTWFHHFLFVPHCESITLNCTMLLQVNLLALIWALLAGHVSCCDCGARAPGDIIIGVINAVHSKVQNLEGRIQAERFNCTGYVFNLIF